MLIIMVVLWSINFPLRGRAGAQHPRLCMGRRAGTQYPGLWEEVRGRNARDCGETGKCAA